MSGKHGDPAVDEPICGTVRAPGRRRGGRVGHEDAFDERQRASAEHVLKERGFDMDHAVLKAFGGARLTIVRLVGIQDDRVTGQAVSLAVPIIETLDTGKRAADRRGVVAVHGIRLAMKPCFDTLDAFYRLRTSHPVGAQERCLSAHDVGAV